MFPQSPIQIIEETPSRLVVVDPPFYLAGMIFLIVGLAMCGFSLVRTGGSDSGERIGWPAFVIAAPFLLIGTGLLTKSNLVAFSRESGTVTISRRCFHVVYSKQVLPLENVQSAAVGLYEQSRSLHLVLKSGGDVAVGHASDRKGYYDAAEAINRFLGSGR